MHIVLIPGLWLDGSSWDAVVPTLVQAGHRPHALTLPGTSHWPQFTRPEELARAILASVGPV